MYSVYQSVRLKSTQMYEFINRFSISKWRRKKSIIVAKMKLNLNIKLFRIIFSALFASNCSTFLIPNLHQNITKLTGKNTHSPRKCTLKNTTDKSIKKNLKKHTNFTVFRRNITFSLFALRCLSDC